MKGITFGVVLGALIWFALIFTGLSLASGGQEKVVVCHNGKSLSVGASAVSAHLAHGDTLGLCFPGDEVIDEEVVVTESLLEEVPRILACASSPVVRQDAVKSVGIAVDLDLNTFESGLYQGVTFTVARFYNGIGATCDNLGGTFTGQFNGPYPVFS